MPGLAPGIHVFLIWIGTKTWMAGTNLAMTRSFRAPRDRLRMPSRRGFHSYIQRVVGRPLWCADQALLHLRQVPKGGGSRAASIQISYKGSCISKKNKYRTYYEW